MTLTTLFLLLAVAWLAYANGANDNFKGVATLFGTGTTSYRVAIWWAMVTTLAGALVAFFLGAALIKAFSGKGLVSASVLSQPEFLLSVGAAAAITVFLATRTGFPVSTTHAIVGGLVGAGLMAPGDVALGLLGQRFLAPLLFAPILAVASTMLLYKLLSMVRRHFSITRETCLCIGEKEEVVAVDAPALMVAEGPRGDVVLKNAQGVTHVRTGIEFRVGNEVSCYQRYSGHVIGLSADRLINAAHFITAGTVGFARGLQDTAKIVGLLVGASLVGAADPQSLAWGVGVVAIFMALGGLISARRVAETLGHKITDMNQGQGFTANFVTSILVAGSAFWGWGVSTTHCSVGALFGIGAVSGTAHWGMIRQIVLAWLITLPVAALLALAIYAAVA